MINKNSDTDIESISRLSKVLQDLEIEDNNIIKHEVLSLAAFLELLVFVFFIFILLMTNVVS